MNKLDLKKDLFSAHESAEFYYQKGNILSCEGFFDDAETHFELAYKQNLKNRYRLAYLESKFKLDSMPSHVELEKLIEVLDEHDFQECSLKAKSLAILGRSPEALQMLRNEHPNEIMMQMVVCTLGEMYEDLDSLIEKNIADEFEDGEKNIYLIH